MEHAEFKIVIENRKGNWIKVEYENQIGFIFSGFVSRVQPLEYKPLNHDCHDLVYIHDWIHHRLKLDSIVNSGNKIEHTGLDEEREEFHIKWTQYDDGTTVTEVLGYEYLNFIYETNSISANDLLNMIDYYIYNRDKNCKDDKYYTLPNLKLEFQQNKSLKSLESSELGGLRIEILDFKTIIEISYEM